MFINEHLKSKITKDYLTSKKHNLIIINLMIGE